MIVIHRTEAANNNNNLFKDGPPATAVEENWLNAVQEEIAYTIEQAGLSVLTASNDTRRQLKTAIELLSSISSLTQRAKFIYKDSDEIYINGGTYLHKGTTDQIVYWNSQLTFQFGSGGSNSDSVDLAVNDWFYVYLDDTAIVAANTSILTASELVANITE
ncbi:MAG: hypothetical protein ACC651_07055, partial [Candidatus Scalindua sp.]